MYKSMLNFVLFDIRCSYDPAMQANKCDYKNKIKKIKKIKKQYAETNAYS